MIVTATVQAVAAQAQNRDEDIPAHEEKLDSERPTYLNLLKVRSECLRLIPFAHMRTSSMLSHATRMLRKYTLMYIVKG